MRSILVSLFTAVFFLAVPTTRAFATPSITLDPTTVTVSQNAQFSVTLKVNSDSTNIMGADATINYAANDLEFVSAVTGGYFSVFTSANNSSAGVLEIHSYTLSTLESHTGNGTLGTLTFKAKKNSGSSAISFTCTNNGHDTVIRSLTGVNILTNCSTTNQVGISYTGSVTSSPTPTTVGSTPTPTQPPSGNAAPQCASLNTNISAATSTPIAVTLTCSGIDTGGYINAAEFVFGDGTSQIVEKNAGSPGSIDTTHTYTTIGAVGATCKVRDNDGVWSSVPENCRKIISIKPKPTATPLPRSYGDRSTGSSPTPTRMVVSMVTETPTPIDNPLGEPTTEPTLYPDDTQGGSTLTSSNRIWWIIGGIIAILLAFLLLRRKDPPKDSEGQVPIANV